MKVVHLLRKPCSEGTVAANVLRHGTGALNIDACRISATDAFGGGAKGTSGFVNGYAADGCVPGSPLGRWPANLVLQHLDGCVQDGTRRVKASGFDQNRPPRSSGIVYGKHKDTPQVRHSDSDGTETVAAWACTPGCPVAALDAQSLAGGMHGAGTSRPPGLSVMNPKDRGLFGLAGHKSNGVRFGDSGGASRFFKQVGGQDDR